MPVDTKQQITYFLQAGKLAEAEESCRDFLKKPEHQDSESWLLMAAIQANLGKLDQVVNCCLKAIDIDPQSPAAYFNLGIAQQSQGDVEAAISSYRKTLAVEPAHPGAHTNLGMLLQSQHNLTDAIFHLDSAAKAQPRNPALQYYLGNAHYQLGNINDAERYFRTALSLSPNDPRINNDLGNLLFSKGRTEEAVSHFRTAIMTEPESFIIHYNLGIALWRIGNNSDAFIHCWHALQLSPDNLSARQSFVQLINSVPQQLLTNDIWEEIEKSFYISGIDSQQLVPVAVKHIQEYKLFTMLANSSSSLDFHDFSRELLDSKYLPLLQDKILLALLSHAVITNFEFESLLTLIRKSLLYYLSDCERTTPAPAAPVITGFLSALATQCFLNEHAYYVEPDEYRKLEKLREELHSIFSASATHGDDLLLRILILASYEPLNKLQGYTLNKIKAFPPLLACAKEVITIQIDEPEKEQRLAQDITSLTTISNNTSRAVQEQYEASPYPRWVNVTLHTPRRYLDVLGEIFPHAELPKFRDKPIEMLIAGCGTGKHPLQSATRFKDIHITAIDLSKASLSYAERKAQEYGIHNIDFYQADILQLENLDRTFHIIESIGVLHHMSNPAKGLEILTSRLVKGGLFNIGLYSSCARRNITAARELLHGKGFLPNTNSIRNARNEIAQLDNRNPAKGVVQTSDFYTLSECRDLLFHVQEHAYTLLEIEQLIGTAGLEFIGFEFNDNLTKLQYKSQHPADPDCINLRNWNLFEHNFKDTFIGMYTFWCKKI